MSLIWKDRVAEISTTTGTGAFTLAGALTSYRAFSSVCATNDTVYYVITAVGNGGEPTGDWETGLGTYSAANTLTRTAVLDSSNAGAAVNFSAGTKRVVLSQVAKVVGWTQLVSQDFAATPASTFEVDVTGYQDIHIVGSDLVHAASVQRNIQVSVDGGSSWFTTSGDYADVSASGALTNNAALFGHNTSTTAARTIDIKINGNSGVNPVSCLVTTRLTQQVFKASATPINHIRLMGSSGGSGTPSGSNFTAGVLRVRARG